MTPKEYRAKSRRCRNCAYAMSFLRFWYCVAKRKAHDGTLSRTRLKGMLCRCYKPREVDE